MPLKDDLKSAVEAVFRGAWEVTAAAQVPEADALTFSNTGKTLTGAVLYADLAASTALVDHRTREFAAEIYKTFLLVAARLIREQGGSITAYDGDRVMAIFVGMQPRTDAIITAFRLNWACRNIVQPALNAQYAQSGYSLAHTCGIDHSELMAAKTGIRGANDLVWVGRAANYAAKLSGLSAENPTWITEAVYGGYDHGKFGGHAKDAIWQPRTWTSMNGQRIYCSNWSWEL